MKLDREGRRTVAQFLNSLSVGIVASLVLAPLASGSLQPDLATGAVLAAAMCHAVALQFSRRAD